MNWYGRVKVAEGHGDTLDGQLMTQEFMIIADEMEQLRSAAIHGGPDDVLPRWRGSIRHEILLLPTVDKAKRMSMYELMQLKARVEDIKGRISKYSRRRYEEILGADNP